MGIKNLRDLFKKQQLFEEVVPMNVFAGKRVLVDASLYVCMYKAVTTTTRGRKEDNFAEAFFNFLAVLKCEGILLFVVFDGSSPKEKTNEREKRREKKDSTIRRIETLEYELQVYETTKIIGPKLLELIRKITTSVVLPPRMVNKLQKGIQSSTDSVEFISPDILNKAKQHVAKQRSYVFQVTNEDWNTVEQLCKALDIQVIHAPGEAEIFCAHMVKQGFADAVLTSDTDVIACSTPTILKSVNIAQKTFTQIKINVLHKMLNLTERELLDLCILCGTDYNNNIRGIGPVKALALMQKHHSIENIGLHTKLDVSVLNYEVVRQLFSCPDTVAPLPEIESILLVEPYNTQLTNFLKDKKISVPLNIRNYLGIQKL